MIEIFTGTFCVHDKLLQKYIFYIFEYAALGAVRDNVFETTGITAGGGTVNIRGAIFVHRLSYRKNKYFDF